MHDKVETIRLNAASLKDLPEIASTIIKVGKDFNIWLFDGPMGSGKTTLIREICDQIGVEDNVNSPSFGLVNEYLSTSEDTIYHFDFYRIRNEEEAERIGISEYFDSGDLCMIEWPEKISSLIPTRNLKISLNITENQGREIYLNKYE